MGVASGQPAPAAATAQSSSSAHRQYLLTAPNGRKYDVFGSSVAVSRNLIAVGAPARTVRGHKHQGAVYLFAKPRSGWGHATVTTMLTARGSHPGDLFGLTVAIAGDTVAVGTPRVTVGTNTHEGAVYLFTKPSGGWSRLHHPTGRLFPTDRTANDLFGWALAGAGNTFVVGAPGHVVGQHFNQGAAYVFVRPRGGWRTHNSQTRELTATKGNSGDGLGSSVALSGRTVVAGAPFTRIGRHPVQGAVTVFTEPRAGWQAPIRDARLTMRRGAANDHFGFAVAVSGRTVAASAPYRTVGTTRRQGAAYVFTRPTGGWRDARQNATLTVVPSAAVAYFGGGMAAAGRHVVGTGYGLASLFNEPLAGWHGVHHQQVQLAGASVNDRIGNAVAMAGSTIVAGAPTQIVGRHIAQGAVYVYVR
jgi:hypothetical protein